MEYAKSFQDYIYLLINRWTKRISIRRIIPEQDSTYTESTHSGQNFDNLGIFQFSEKCLHFTPARFAWARQQGLKILNSCSLRSSVNFWPEKSSKRKGGRRGGTWESIEWLTEDHAFSRSYDLSPRQPPPPALPSVSSTRDILLPEEGMRGLARSQIIWPQESWSCILLDAWAPRVPVLGPVALRVDSNNINY